MWKYSQVGGLSKMTDKQLYTLCGAITLSAAIIANSPVLAVSAFFWFIFSIREEKK